VGAENLTIIDAGRYRLLVAPNDENAAWSIHYRPIMGFTLFSRDADG
jgi:hypothetical protein